MLQQNTVLPYALFPIKVGDVGEGKNFFSREKAERRHRSIPSPTPPSFFKKSEVWLLQTCPAIAFGDGGLSQQDLLRRRIPLCYH